MHAYLTRLGVQPAVQTFFESFYFSEPSGDLRFAYTNGEEHYGFAFHRVPITDGVWLAGNLNFKQVRLAILSVSALDAIAWLNKKLFRFADRDGLLFVSFGAAVRPAHLHWILDNLKEARFRMIFSKDVLGRCADLKVAAGIRGMPVSIYAGEQETILVRFRSRNFCFSQEMFSLGVFEKAAGIRFGIPASKPTAHHTFFEELKTAAGL